MSSCEHENKTSFIRTDFFYLLLLEILLHLVTYNDTHTQSVGLPWTRDQPLPAQHTELTRDKHPCPGRLQLANPASECPQTYALDSAATGIG
jgi:hypothetical protein